MNRIAATAPTRIVLVGEERPAQQAAEPGPAVRRYRFARLRLNEPSPAGDRYAHLRRSYD